MIYIGGGSLWDEDCFVENCWSDGGSGDRWEGEGYGNSTTSVMGGINEGAKYMQESESGQMVSEKVKWA